MHCDPHANEQRDVCVECGDDGRPDCATCGGEEPRAQDVFCRVYDAGYTYDQRRSGADRSLHIERYEGHWVASWRNGPFDQWRHGEPDTNVPSAVAKLAAWLEDAELQDAAE